MVPYVCCIEMKIKIRELKEEDIEEIVKMKSFLFVSHVKLDNFYRPKKNFKQMYRDHMKTIITSGDHKILVAINGKDIIGFIEGSITYISDFFEKNELGSVYEIFVKEKYRESGIARKLLETLVKWFKSRKIKTIEVVVDFRNKKAIKAWEHLGFGEFQKKMKLTL